VEQYLRQFDQSAAYPKKGVVLFRLFNVKTLPKNPSGVPLWHSTGDLLNRDAFSQSFLSSTSKNWKDVIVERHRSTGHELVDVMFKQHVFVLTVGCRCDWEFKRNGQLRQFPKANGTVSFFPSYVPFFGRLKVEKGMSAEFLFVALDPVFVSSTADRLELKPNRIALREQFRKSDSALRHIALALQTAVHDGDVGDEMYGESLSTALAVHLLRSYGGAELSANQRRPGLSRASLIRAVEYIQDQLNAPLTVSDIAQTVQLSPYHFSRAFKESTGQSPHQYVIEARVRRAREILRTGKFTIGEAAYKVGFVDQSHLTRHFKRVFGVPPKVLLCHRK
jgi:AraC family transcriptional regulator